MAPVRFGLALAVVLAAIARGLSPGRAFAQLALGAVVIALALMFGQRTRGLDDVLERAEPLPADARREPPRTTVWTAMWPSTMGTTFFAVAAVFIDARLAALLAGVLAGMGVAGLAYGLNRLWWERERGVRLLGDRRSGRVFLEPR